MAESSNIKARDIVKGVFSSVAPVTMNSVGSARSVVSDVRNIGRKINTNMRQSMMQIDKSQPGRKAIAMFNAAKQSLTDGTYEAIGIHFNGNKHNLDKDILVRHGTHILDVPRTFDGIKQYLAEHHIEGIVFWLNGEPMCKIKRSDFGFDW